MSHGRSDAEMVKSTHNTARFFTESRHIAWVLLITTLVWGIFGYLRMPQRKDPEVPVRLAVAMCSWPGASAEKIELLVTRPIEEKMRENSNVERVDSVTRNGIAVVYVLMDEATKDRAKEFDDIQLKLDTIHGLPDGAGPIVFLKDFGDTVTLMLTVASPPASGVEIALRARDGRRAIEAVRATVPPALAKDRLSILYSFPRSIDGKLIERAFGLFLEFARQRGALRDARPFSGAGFVGVDAQSELDDAALLALGDEFIRDRLRESELHPDAWQPTVVRDPGQTESRLAAIAGSKYSYKELDEFTDLMKRTLLTLPTVSKVSRVGALEERVYLEYSQERLASYGVQTSKLPDILRARNVTLPGGTIEVEGKNLNIDPSGEFRSEAEIGDVLLPSAAGRQVYLRDIVSVVRAYQSPPPFLNYYTHQDASGVWRRDRAVTLAVQMKSGQQIGVFGKSVDAALEELKKRLPEDLVMARTSDQPLQVEENVDLFMVSLYEAVFLVVLVSLIGFWEWRSAVLMAFSIPITVAMTFGMMNTLGIDIQQVSIASLIIALGLLVDDPVVAGDAIKRDLAAGHPRLIAAWLGPTKLATAIMFATITNIVAYLPFLMLTGDMGKFMYSLPIVIGCSLVASRLVSMTFIPLLGYYLLRPKAERSIEQRRSTGFASRYYRLGRWSIEHRWTVALGSLLFLGLGVLLGATQKTEYMPKDLSYLSYIDVWLPEDAPLSATAKVAAQTEATVREVSKRFGHQHAPEGGKAPQAVLRSLTTFIGGGGPRFWFSVSPEMQQPNYAQILIQVNDKHHTSLLVPELQEALLASVPGARIDVRQLDTAGLGIPVQVRLSGEDIPTLRALAARVRDVFRSIPRSERTRDDWGSESFVVRLKTDPDRANLAGVSNLEVAWASASAMSGSTVGTLRQGEDQIPVVARLRMEERARLSDVENLYVYASQGGQKVPLSLISTIEYAMETAKLARRNQFRTITVSCFPVGGVLASEVLTRAMPRLEEIRASLPPGYRLELGGEYEEQNKGFVNMAIVMAISVAGIFLALVIQFRHAFKPVLVFAAIPYGMVGAMAALAVMRSPFGFMAFLGIASLVGVIVSHVIVLFDFIEEKHAEGEPLELALLDAGILRLRPVMITVGATVIALIPLAAHGGPLWASLCYAQIGGLLTATFVTLLLVPVFYAIAVKDLKLVRWEKAHGAEAGPVDPVGPLPSPAPAGT